MFFFFKQKTAYEMRISDWSSDVCSSDLLGRGHQRLRAGHPELEAELHRRPDVGPGDVVAVAHPHHHLAGDRSAVLRSEERRVGKECVSTCRSRWSPYH